MFHYIKGILAMKTEDGVVVETGGIGFEVTVPANSGAYLAAEGDSIMLYLYMAVKEDDISLYGFSEREGLELFKLLITVNGVGAKAAMSILSAMPISECRKAIVFEDAAMLTRANGIGKKTAQRIVLELKDKVEKVGAEMAAAAAGGAEGAAADAGDDAVIARGEAVNALIALGYSRSEAMTAVNAVTEKELTSEEYIKKALKQLF